MKFLLLLLSLISTVSFGQTLENLPKDVKKDVIINDDPSYNLIYVRSKLSDFYWPGIEDTYLVLSFSKDLSPFFTLVVEIESHYKEYDLQKIIIKTDSATFEFSDFLKKKSKNRKYTTLEKYYINLSPDFSTKAALFLNEIFNAKPYTMATATITYVGKYKKDEAFFYFLFKDMLPVYKTYLHIKNE